MILTAIGIILLGKPNGAHPNQIVSSNLCEIFEVGKIGANLPNWI